MREGYGKGTALRSMTSAWTYTAVKELKRELQDDGNTHDRGRWALPLQPEWLTKVRGGRLSENLPPQKTAHNLSHGCGEMGSRHSSRAGSRDRREKDEKLTLHMTAQLSHENFMNCGRYWKISMFHSWSRLRSYNRARQTSYTTQMYDHDVDDVLFADASTHWTPQTQCDAERQQTACLAVIRTTHRVTDIYAASNNSWTDDVETQQPVMSTVCRQNSA